MARVALARRTAIPVRRTALICHYMKRPENAKKNIDSTVASTATAQNQRDVTCRGVAGREMQRGGGVGWGPRSRKAGRGAAGENGEASQITGGPFPWRDGGQGVERHRNILHDK
jgi:hypothetical protein